jgi:hypothetical protein
MLADQASQKSAATYISVPAKRRTIVDQSEGVTGKVRRLAIEDGATDK